MANLTTKSIRNVALLGHGGSGKTTLAEAMLYGSGTIDRFGRTPDGTTICDYDTEEIRRGFSLSLATANLMWKDIKINVLDTPGYLDFSGEVLQGVRVADAAVITIDGKAGLEVGAELAWVHYLSQKEIYISTGSACSAKKPSRVMTAVGKGDLSRYSLRFSFSRYNTEEEVPVVLEALSEALNHIRKD